MCRFKHEPGIKINNINPKVKRARKSRFGKPIKSTRSKLKIRERDLLAYLLIMVCQTRV